MMMARGVAQPTELMKALNALAPYPCGVVNVRFTIDTDWSGDPAIFFWITLEDEAAGRAVLSRTTHSVINHINEQLNPMDQWGLIPYFNFRSQSEQAKLKDEVFG